MCVSFYLGQHKPACKRGQHWHRYFCEMNGTQAQEMLLVFAGHRYVSEAYSA